MSSTDGDEDLFEDPEPEVPSLGPDPPSVDVPEVERPGPDPIEPGDDVDPELYGLFWRLVVVFDVALFSLAVGPMFVYFEGDWRLGLSLFGFGALSFAYGVFRYRQYRYGDDSASDGSASDHDSAGDDADTASESADPEGRDDDPEAREE